MEVLEYNGQQPGRNGATQHPTYLHAAPRVYRLRLVYGADIHRLRAAGLLRELATPLFYAGAAARKR